MGPAEPDSDKHGLADRPDDVQVAHGTVLTKMPLYSQVWLVVFCSSLHSGGKSANLLYAVPSVIVLRIDLGHSLISEDAEHLSTALSGFRPPQALCASPHLSSLPGHTRTSSRASLQI